MRAVANAGPLIHLSWIDQLELLGHLFDEVLVPEAVRQEVLPVPWGVLRAEALRHAFGTSWPRVQAASDQADVVSLAASLDAGEAEAIVLMQGTDADLLLLDERRARREAVRRGLRFTGTVGLLQTAKLRGLINAAYPHLREIQRAGFWLSTELLDQVRREES